MQPEALLRLGALATTLPRDRQLKSATVHADGRLMDLSAIALQGLEEGQVQLDGAAARLAGAGAASADGTSPDTVDLSAEIAALMSAQTQFSASLSILKTAGKIQTQRTNTGLAGDPGSAGISAVGSRSPSRCSGSLTPAKRLNFDFAQGRLRLGHPRNSRCPQGS